MHSLTVPPYTCIWPSKKLSLSLPHERIFLAYKTFGMYVLRAYMWVFGMCTNGSSSYTICKSVLCCVWKITKCQSVANFCSNIVRKIRSKVRKNIFSVNIPHLDTRNLSSLVEKCSEYRRKLYLKYWKVVLYRDLTHTHTRTQPSSSSSLSSSEEPLRLLNNIPTRQHI